MQIIYGDEAPVAGLFKKAFRLKKISIEVKLVDAKGKGKQTKRSEVYFVVFAYKNFVKIYF